MTIQPCFPFLYQSVKSPAGFRPCCATGLEGFGRFPQGLRRPGFQRLGLRPFLRLEGTLLFPFQEQPEAFPDSGQLSGQRFVPDGCGELAVHRAALLIQLFSRHPVLTETYTKLFQFFPRGGRFGFGFPDRRQLFADP